MVCVLVLAAAIGAAAVVLVFRLWIVLRPQDVTPRESLNLLVVAGSGGHTTEILRLVGSLSSAYTPRHYVIADTDKMSANKIKSFELDQANRDYSTMCTQYYIHRIPRSREVQQSWLSTVFTTLYSTWLSFPLIHRVKPDLRIVAIFMGNSQLECTVIDGNGDKTFLVNAKELYLSSIFNIPVVEHLVGHETFGSRTTLTFPVLEIEPMALHMLGKGSATDLHPQP